MFDLKSKPATHLESMAALTNEKLMDIRPVNTLATGRVQTPHLVHNTVHVAIFAITALPTGASLKS